MRFFSVFLMGMMLFHLEAAQVLELDGNFEKRSPEGKVLHWVFHNWSGFKPDPVLKVIEKGDSGKNVLSIRKVTAGSGTVLRPHKRFPGRSGDKVRVSFRAKGVGSGTIGLYFYKRTGSSSWNQAGPTHTFALKKQWTDYTFTLPVTDGIGGMTTDYDIVLGCKKGNELDLSSVEAHHEGGLYRGDARIPIQWTVFAPVPKNFKASAQQLKEIPLSFGGSGAKKYKAQLMGNTLDFAPFLGGKGAYKCAWAFAVLDSRIECDYSIGASADWWMEFYHNGEKVFDTMDDGNGKPVRINSHIAKIRLKKGKNIFAVKIITGKASSHFVLGGPADLRKIVRSIALSKIHWIENFDRKTAQVTPVPRLVRREVTPGLLTLTGQAVYSRPGGKNMTIRGKGSMISIPENKEEYGAFSIRIQKFGTPEGKGNNSILTMNVQDKQNFFLLQIRPVGKKTPLLRLQFSDNQGVIGSETIPARLLPADFTLALSAAGRYVLRIHSLVDSSSKTLEGNSAALKKMRHCEAALLLRNGSVTLDNYIIGIARDQDNRAAAPCKLGLEKTFDPVKAKWPLLFSDEFNGTKIDLNKWYFSYNANRDFAWQKDGLLYIQCDWNKEKTKLQSAALWTKKEFLYGYFEAKVRFRYQPGWWSAFWLCSPTPTNSFIDGMEIDIFEDYYLRPAKKGDPPRDILDHNLHMNAAGNTKSWNYNSRLPGKISDFYVIGCKWTPFEISYYLNGKLIASKANHSPHDSVTFDAVHHGAGVTPLKAIVSGQCGASGGSAKDGVFPEYYLVDYVRIYGLPGSQKNQTVKLECDQKGFPAVMGDTLNFTVKVPQGDSPVKTVYLFDSGFLLEHKSKPPYTFQVPVTKEYYDISNYASPGRSGKALPFGPFLHAYSAFVQYESGAVARSGVIRKLFAAGEKSRPWKGIPHKIPGRIRTSHFDLGGENVGYFDRDYSNRVSKTFRTEENVDCNPDGIYFTLAGEWMNYTVDVAESGSYSLTLTYGCPINPNAGIELFVDDMPAGILETRTTKDWSIRYKTTLKGIRLSKGRHVLKLMLRTNGVNMSDMVFTKE